MGGFKKIKTTYFLCSTKEGHFPLPPTPPTHGEAPVLFVLQEVCDLRCSPQLVAEEILIKILENPSGYLIVCYGKRSRK